MNQKHIIFLAALAFIVLGGAGVVVYNMARGIRNNNPGNIRHGDNWQGMATEQTDPAFVQFVSPVYGIRALNKVLRSYSERHGLTTVYDIINRWAPPSENDTISYAMHVAEKLGVGVHWTINVEEYAEKLTEAIIQHENGQQPYSAATIQQGVTLAWA